MRVGRGRGRLEIFGQFGVSLGGVARHNRCNCLGMKNVRVEEREGSSMDMTLIGERIVALAELALREHLAAISRSQADELYTLAARARLGEETKQ